jgi:hypothetical protein
LVFSELRGATEYGLVAASHKERQRYWKAWSEWCKHHHLDPELRADNPATTVATLQAFAAFVQQGSVGRGRQVGAQAVQVALHAIGAHFELDARPDPCYRNGTTPKHWKAIEQQIEGYRRADPVPQAKLAVPVSVPRWCVTKGLKSATTKSRAIGDLTNAAFYYLLRVGEYTYLGTKQRQRTQQFRVRDVKFWKNGQVLPLNSGATALLDADAATLTRTNQKNGTKGAVIHNDPIHTSHCPIRSLARRVSDILAFTTTSTRPSLPAAHKAAPGTYFPHTSTPQ